MCLLSQIISLSNRISSLDEVHRVSYYPTAILQKLKPWVFVITNIIFFVFSCDIQNFIRRALPIRWG